MLAPGACQTGRVSDTLLGDPPAEPGHRSLTPHAALQRARLYLVCGGLPSGRLSAALDGGVDIVQLRMKDAQDQAVLLAAERLLAICRGRDVPLIVNDRPDLAAAAGADGVHLGQDDSAPELARELLGADALIGLSTHSPAQVDAAADAEVDYIGVGPVNATPTKPGRAAVGLELVRYASAHARLPFFAIGGITPANAPDVVAAGAQRLAVVRAIAESEDPVAGAAALRSALGPEEASVGAT